MIRSLVLLLLTLVCAAVNAADLFVAPNGNDDQPGSRSQPLRSLDGARLAVRRLKQETREPITVHFAPGTYRLPSTVVFTAEDSGSPQAPVTYRASAERSAIISGGRRWRLEWQSHRDGIWKARVPPEFRSDQLFVDGRRQHMARYPNFDPNAQYFNGFSRDSTSRERVRSWARPEGGYLHAMHRSLWGDFHYVVTGKKNPGELELRGGWQNNRRMGMHADYRFVENIFEELDAPGEWYHDAGHGVLYYYPQPGVDVRQAEVEAVRLRHLVEFRGSDKAPVRHVSIIGFTFSRTARTFMDNREPLLRSDWTTYRGGAIVFRGAQNCSIRDAFIDQVGGNAVFVDGYNRSVEVTGCEISDAGASAISFVGKPEALRSPLFEYHQTQSLEEMDRVPGPRSNAYPAHCLVEDNLIYCNGRFEKQTAGVNIAMASEITVRHNSIYECPRAGINICDGAFGGHVIEGNDVFDTVLETGDHGSFNSWGRDRFWHPDRRRTAEWVRKHPDMPRWDCQKKIVLRNNRWRCDHGWDIDLDDGSSYYELTNNLCLAGGIKLREGYFRAVYNNILVDYSFCPHVWYPDSKSSFRRNIVFNDRYHPAGMKGPIDADENLVHAPGVEARPARGLKEFSRNDERSLVADAMFVAPLEGDYRVRDGSPALRLGFKNFPMDRFGVRKPALRARARIPALPGTLAAAAIVSGGWGRKYAAPRASAWLGARIRDLKDGGEISAFGLGSRHGVLVEEVPDGSAAQRRGLRTNDVLLALDGEKVKNVHEFARKFGALAKGRSVKITVWREQKRVEVVVAKP